MNEWISGKQRGPHWNSCPWSCQVSILALHLPPGRVSPSLHLPKYLRPMGARTQDPPGCLPSLLFTFHFVDETWRLPCSLCVFFGFVNQSWLFGLRLKVSKNTEGVLSLGSSFLGILRRIQTPGMQISPRVLPSLWRRLFRP